MGNRKCSSILHLRAWINAVTGIIPIVRKPKEQIMLNKRLVVGCLTIFGTLISINVLADITMQQRITVEAGGAMSFMSLESTVTTSISSDKSRSETKMAPKSGLMGSLMKNLDTTSIMRLDKDLIWELRPKKQQYSEMTFEQMREQMELAMEQLKDVQESGSAGALPVSEEDCQWSDPKFESIDTGEKKRFANVKAKQHIITIEETCTVPESGQTCVLTWTMENWMAKRMPGDEETIEFNKALAEKLGTEEMLAGAQAMSRALLSMFKSGWEEALDEMSELKGYPVKTVMQMEIGGESCTATSGQPIAMDSLWNNALEAGVNSASQNAGYHAGQAISKETRDAMGNSVGGSVAGSAAGAATSELISGLFKKFGKKKKKTDPEPTATATAPAAAPSATGSTVLFRVTTELISINDDKISQDRFELPSGWKKVSWK